MLRLFLQRYEVTQFGTFGDIADANGNLVVHNTLEPTPVDIPDGEHRCDRYLSPHFGYEVFVIEVEGHDKIELHIGNTLKDTHGCVLLGEYREGPAIGGSKAAFDAFMKLLNGVSEFTLVVTSNG